LCGAAGAAGTARSLSSVMPLSAAKRRERHADEAVTKLTFPLVSSTA
jgi:hypothetical protein